MNTSTTSINHLVLYFFISLAYGPVPNIPTTGYVGSLLLVGSSIYDAANETVLTSTRGYLLLRYAA